ncbi:cell division protein FtsZ [Candidatus Giovannonibacteria bacterium RIFCSPHIGHO2_01_FULL_45_33]|uniref:Cell division protein FtsZ n=1 Tax=Candidatus Yanofskybacteria bacterium RIFCSPLOWO2_01_FULL_49_25 TaxID=1802701 RepID=A0A1F8GSV9_9BACT|nr:MAG: cell division protein FtsZ [Candidatus Giovannonibacteria bacterium RIFCSPHIGHO2_01_FULL_45_33]OGF69700.1 MAG: cell division protein FtsZ [Candidatus Giovannonibacteria bacterium RIFCSPHIGHO2_02_FULL_44_11]OGN28514.1 MAG: cell division protein FtsZ [Candidatus Yanofskybacteria bacterium RIFCSPLOWO2_01_FULL_49_25]
MPQIKPEIESFARIKVVGVGGSGKNAVNHMVKSKVRGVEFLAVNTDAQDLHQSLAHKKIRIGKGLTKGLGTGMNPELGRQAAEETRDEILEALKGADMVFVTCGMGGGTGTGGAPVVAQAAKSQGALTIGVVTRPFAFEGAERARLAESGLSRLREAVDALIIIPNDKLLSVVSKDTSFLSAFSMCDEVLRHAVEGISDLITMPGVINVDFADVKSIMQNAGSALMGIGHAEGESRAEEAAKTAISSPLLDVSINGARGVLFAIAGGPDMTMWEIQSAAKVITESIDSDAKVIFGAIQDERLKKGQLKITVIASGFPDGATGKAPTLFGGFSAKTANISKTADAKADIKNAIEQNTSDGNRTNGSGIGSIFSGASSFSKKENPTPEDSEWDSIPAFIRRQKK